MYAFEWLKPFIVVHLLYFSTSQLNHLGLTCQRRYRQFLNIFWRQNLKFMNEDASTKKIWLRVNFLNFTEGEYYKSEKKNLQLYLTVYIK